MEAVSWRKNLIGAVRFVTWVLVGFGCRKWAVSHGIKRIIPGNLTRINYCEMKIKSSNINILVFDELFGKVNVSPN